MIDRSQTHLSKWDLDAIDAVLRRRKNTLKGWRCTKCEDGEITLVKGNGKAHKIIYEAPEGYGDDWVEQGWLDVKARVDTYEGIKKLFSEPSGDPATPEEVAEYRRIGWKLYYGERGLDAPLPCYLCGGREFWRSKAMVKSEYRSSRNALVCARCHRPHFAEDVAEYVTLAVAVNKRKDPFDVYIGRPSKWGNPFSVSKYGREQSVRKYYHWVIDQPELMKDIPELRGKRLGCFCKPLECHGDILAMLANQLEREE